MEIHIYFYRRLETSQAGMFHYGPGQEGSTAGDENLEHLLPDRRYTSICCHATRLQSSFTPQAVGLFNTQHSDYN